MNTVGVITLFLVLLSWVGGVVSWFYCAYHGLMSWRRSHDPRQNGSRVVLLMQDGMTRSPSPTVD
jgi:hypothetical protein